jgi:hypothetical protein
MKRYFGLVLLTAALAVTAASAGDNPPKGQPGPPDKKEAKKGDPAKPDEAAQEEAKKTKELVARIAKDMEASEKRLAKKDPKEATQQIQRDIVKNLDELMEQLKKKQDDENKDGGGGGGGGGQQKSGGAKGSQGGAQGNSGGAKQQGGGSSKAQSKGSQGGEGQQGQGKDAGQGGQGQQGQKKAGDKDGQGGEGKTKEGGKNGGAEQVGKAKTDNERHNPLADLHRDVWGHLPEQRRLEMDAYARERLMERYQELLRQYYRTISEQSRQKD